MATHDYVIANGTGAAVRSDLNNALAAIVSNNSGSSEPGTTYAYQWWADTNANVLKIRNSANNAWITLRELDGTMLIEDGSASTPGLAFASDLDTGLFRSTDNRLNFATGGTERLELGSSEAVFNDPSDDYDFRVESNNSTHMLFVDAGNDRLGVRESSPDATLHVSEGNSGASPDSNRDTLFIENNANAGITIASPNTNDCAIAFADPEDNNAGEIRYSHNDNFMKFHTAGSETVRVDSSGNVAIGTSSAGLKLHVQDGALASAPTPNSNCDVVIEGTTNTGIQFLSSGNVQLRFGDAGSTGAGSIIYTHSSNDLRLSTNGSERMRIDSSGLLQIGTTAGTGNLNVAGTGDAALDLIADSDNNGSNQWPIINFRRNSATGTPAARIYHQESSTSLNFDHNGTEFFRCTSLAHSVFSAEDYVLYALSENASSSGIALFTGRHSATIGNNNSGTLAVRIFTSGTVSNATGTYNSLSDERLKENIVDATSQWDDIKNLRIRKFNYAENTGHPTHTQIGLVAQEAEQICPGLVEDNENQEDAVCLDKDGNQLDSTKSVRQSVLYMKAVKALQEAQTRIETLETQNTAQQTQINDLITRVTALEG